jgi:hypothetical protein
MAADVNAAARVPATILVSGTTLNLAAAFRHVHEARISRIVP